MCFIMYIIKTYTCILHVSYLLCLLLLYYYWQIITAYSHQYWTGSPHVMILLGPSWKVGSQYSSQLCSQLNIQLCSLTNSSSSQTHACYAVTTDCSVLQDARNSVKWHIIIHDCTAWQVKLISITTKSVNTNQ